MIASRSLLRVIPLISSLIHKKNFEVQGLDPVLSTFRNASASWVVTIWPHSLENIVRFPDFFSAHEKNEFIINRIFSTDSITFPVFVAADAAFCSAVIDFESPVAYAMDTIKAAKEAVSGFTQVYSEQTETKRYSGKPGAPAYSTGMIMAEILNDISKLSENMPVETISRLPLWSSGVPKWVQRNWNELEKYLIGRDEHWQVWTEWYEDRLYGLGHVGNCPVIEALEYERIRIPDEDWDKGPKHINALIAELEEKYRPERERLQRGVVARGIKQFQEEFNSYSAQFAGMGHNGPPPNETISQSELIAGHKRVVEFSQAADNIFEESQKPASDFEKVNRSLALLTSSLNWFAARANVFIDEFLKWTARASAPIVVSGIAVWADILPSMANVIQSVQAWLKLLL